MVALAYLATIYTDTYGSALDYVTAFAAGAGGTFAASWKLLPWYTTFKQPKLGADAEHVGLDKPGLSLRRQRYWTGRRRNGLLSP